MERQASLPTVKQEDYQHQRKLTGSE